LRQTAQLTGIDASSLSRFESNRSQPSFDDVCLIAQKFGWPLLYFATGRLRTGTDNRALAAQLYYWGLRDLGVSRRPVLGEIRAFEDVLAESVRDGARARVIEAVPALLLRNDFAPADLVDSARRYGTLRRVGWLSEVAERISRKLELRWMHPDAAVNVRRTWKSAWHDVKKAEPQGEVFSVEPILVEDAAKLEYISPSSPGRAPTKAGEQDLPGREWQDTPPVTRRWGIVFDLALDDFFKRAQAILGGRDIDQTD
jgi:transcriptional regulator with XRE-family HTH domain